jgi:hypothetical protein
VYDAFVRSFKRLCVVITIDLRLSAKKKSRVDAQNRASSKIFFDSNFVKKKKNARKKKNEENEEKEKKKKKE